MVYFVLRICHTLSTKTICYSSTLPPKSGHFHSKPCYLVPGTLWTFSQCIFLLPVLLVKPILYTAVSDLFKAEIRPVTPCFKPPKDSHHSEWNPKCLLSLKLDLAPACLPFNTYSLTLPHSHCSSHISPLTRQAFDTSNLFPTQYLCNCCPLCRGSYMAGFTIHLIDTSSMRPSLIPQSESSPFLPNTLHPNNFLLKELSCLPKALTWVFLFLPPKTLRSGSLSTLFDAAQPKPSVVLGTS